MCCRQGQEGLTQDDVPEAEKHCEVDVILIIRRARGRCRYLEWKDLVCCNCREAEGERDAST
jgi:hypothetical protein